MGRPLGRRAQPPSPPPPTHTRHTRHSLAAHPTSARAAADILCCCAAQSPCNALRASHAHRRHGRAGAALRDALFGRLLGDASRLSPWPHARPEPSPAELAELGEAEFAALVDALTSGRFVAEMPSPVGPRQWAGIPDAVGAARSAGGWKDCVWAPMVCVPAGSRRVWSVCVCAPQYGPYGTRSQTLAVVWRSGEGEVRERFRRPDGSWGEEVEVFRMQL